MDIQTLEKGNRLTRRIENLEEIKKKVSWYENNAKMNKDSIVGFATTSSKSLGGSSIIDESIYPVFEIMAEYNRRLDFQIKILNTQLTDL